MQGEGSCGYKVWQDEVEMSTVSRGDERITSTLTNCIDRENDNLLEECNQINNNADNMSAIVEMSIPGRVDESVTSFLSNLTNCSNTNPTHTNQLQEYMQNNNGMDKMSAVFETLHHLQVLGSKSGKREHSKCQEHKLSKSSQRLLKRSRRGELLAPGSLISAGSLTLRFTMNSMPINQRWMAVAIHQNLSPQLRGWWGRIAFHPLPCLMIHVPQSSTCCVYPQLDSDYVVQEKFLVNSGASTMLDQSLLGVESYNNSISNPSCNAELSLGNLSNNADFSLSDFSLSEPSLSNPSYSAELSLSCPYNAELAFSSPYITELSLSSPSYNAKLSLSSPSYKAGLVVSNSYDADASIIKPLHDSVDIPSQSSSFCETGCLTPMTQSISKAFSQAAELLQNDLLNLLENMDAKDHEAMSQAAEATFAALNHLSFNYQHLKERTREYIDHAMSLAEIEQSMAINDSCQQLVDYCCSERMRLDDIDINHAKAVDIVTDNKKRLKLLREEISSIKDWLFQIEAEVSCSEIEIRSMEHKLEQVSEDRVVLEERYLIAAMELELSQKLRLQKEEERDVAKAAFDRARALLRE